MVNFLKEIINCKYFWRQKKGVALSCLTCLINLLGSVALNKLKWTQFLMYTVHPNISYTKASLIIGSWVREDPVLISVFS